MIELQTELYEDDDESSADLRVITTEKVWRQIMAKDKWAPSAVLRKEIEIHPRMTTLQTFMGYFDTD